MLINKLFGDFQIKKYPKTDAKTLYISPLSVFSAPLWFDNLFLGNPLPMNSARSLMIY
nr:hypothetical protein [Nostoc sp. EkiNYC01]